MTFVTSQIGNDLDSCVSDLSPSKYPSLDSAETTP